MLWFILGSIFGGTITLFTSALCLAAKQNADIEKNKEIKASILDEGEEYEYN